MSTIDMRRPLSIMVVDDDFDVLFTLSSYLKATGYQVTKFIKPEEALAAIRESSFDVIISDIKMPRITGLDILEATRRHSPDTPLIFMTAYADLETAIQAVKNGAFDFLIKPLDYELVSCALAKACAVVRGNRMEKDYLTQLEEGVLKKTAELRNALFEREVAQQATLKSSETKSEFLAKAGRDLRATLKEIIDQHLRLKETPLAAAQQEILNKATAATEAVQAVVEQLVTYGDSRVEQGEQRSCRFALREMIQQTLHILQARAEIKGLTYSCTIDQATPDILWGDFHSFGQVLETLVGSAVRFTTEGEIDVRVGLKEHNGSQVILEVGISVEGIEIPADQSKAFFKEFSLGEAGLGKTCQGLGIGLTVAKLLAVFLGGTLWLETTPDCGTVFRFTACFQEG